LENKQYVQDLQREGSRARLNDDIAFRDAAARATMGNNLEIMNKTIDNNTLFSQNERDFKRKLAQVSIADAYQMFNNEVAAGKQQAMWSGLANVAKAGIGAYGTFSSSKDTGPTNKSANEGLVGKSDSTFAPKQQSSGTNTDVTPSRGKPVYG